MSSELLQKLTGTGYMPHILAIEQKMIEAAASNPSIQFEPKITHYQIEGVYVREMFIPAGTLLTGKVHNKENISILSQGEIKIATGEYFTYIKAPHVMIDPPGTKRIGYAVTDCTFTNVFRTDTTDIKELEAEITSDSFEDFEKRLLNNQNLIGVDL